MTVRVNDTSAMAHQAASQSFNTNAALKKILALNPKASLDEIRSFHPALEAMSYDQLGLRVSRLLDSSGLETL